MGGIDVICEMADCMGQEHGRKIRGIPKRREVLFEDGILLRHAWRSFHVFVFAR